MLQIAASGLYGSYVYTVPGFSVSQSSIFGNNCAWIFPSKLMQRVDPRIGKHIWNIQSMPVSDRVSALGGGMLI